jgi:ribonuclease BN (tRNA processing enzyme)
MVRSETPRTMKFKVLGCSGGIGRDLRTTSFLWGDNVLIDAGTGVEDLSTEAMQKIDHVFLTHSHLDHVVGLPLMVDCIGSLRDKPLVVHALPDTIAALKTHVFNWVIWPDFTEIPHFDRPYLAFEPFEVGDTVQLEHSSITVLPARHTVAAVGFQCQSLTGSLAFSGDTSPNEEFWQAVNGISDLKALLVETAFANREQDRAVIAKHLFPIQLAEELAKLKLEVPIYITHMKPVDAELIGREVGNWVKAHAPQLLERGLELDI